MSNIEVAKSLKSTRYRALITDETLFLCCSYAEKDQVKKLGARWDKATKRWTVASTVANKRIFAQWLGRKKG